MGARNWAQMIESCRRAGWSAHAKLGEAWVALEQRDHERALGIADALVGTEVDADAAYLAGHIRAERSRSPEEEEAGRALLLRALAGCQAARHHEGASLAAGYRS